MTSGAVVTTASNMSNVTNTNNVDAVAAAVNEAIKDMEYEASMDNNVKVEAQPVDTHANMSPETLTAISGSSSPQPPPSGSTSVGQTKPMTRGAAAGQLQSLFQTETKR